jgi:2C-methyl-D-erythritol 2,4-cyclodiphosphate synthase
MMKNKTANLRKQSNELISHTDKLELMRGTHHNSNKTNELVNLLSKKGYDIDEINWKIMAQSPKLTVPKQEKTLFVLKPFKKYEPFKTTGMQDTLCK